jgi:hypothetical protein
MGMFVLFGLASCRSYESVARREFERQFSCPDDRLSSRATAALPPYQGVPDARPAPSEIREDPERLRIWDEVERDRAREARQAEQSSPPEFEVEGCGWRAVLTCSPGYRSRARSCRARAAVSVAPLAR